MGGKHVGCKPLPASFAGDLTSGESIVAMENLRHLYPEEGLILFLDHTPATGLVVAKLCHAGCPSQPSCLSGWEGRLCRSSSSESFPQKTLSLYKICLKGLSGLKCYKRGNAEQMQLLL